MRPSSIAGLLLLVAGIATLVLGGTFTKSQDVLEVGDLKVSTSVQRPISPWIASAAILAGAALLIGGMSSRNGTAKF